MTSRSSVARPSPGRGGGASRPVLAPALAAIGLVIAAILTIGLFTGNLPFLAGTGAGGDGGGGGAGPAVTPAPSDVVIAEPEKEIAGTFLYVKQGSIWLQQGKDTRRLTTSGRDSMPSWSPDGQWVYFLRTEKGRGLLPAQGRPVYPRARGLLHVGLGGGVGPAQVAASPPPAEAGARARDGAAQVVLLGPRGADAGPSHPLVTQVYLDGDKRMVDHDFLLFLSEQSAYAPLAQGGRCFHPSVAPLVGALVSKLQALYELTPV